MRANPLSRWIGIQPLQCTSGSLSVALGSQPLDFHRTVLAHWAVRVARTRLSLWAVGLRSNRPRSRERSDRRELTYQYGSLDPNPTTQVDWAVRVTRRSHSISAVRCDLAVHVARERWGLRLPRSISTVHIASGRQY